jgi:hypothetical protein
MPKYIIERVVPGSGALTTRSLQKIARSSFDAITQMSHRIQWVESWVTADKWFCLYIAPDEDTIREHATLVGFPADAIYEVMARVDPVTAEGHIPWPSFGLDDC